MSGFDNDWYKDEDSLRYKHFVHQSEGNGNDSLDDNAVDPHSLSPRGDRDLPYITQQCPNPLSSPDLTSLSNRSNYLLSLDLTTIPNRANYLQGTSGLTFTIQNSLDCSACREPLASPSQYKTAQTALPAGNLWPHLHNTKQLRLLCLQGTSGLTFTIQNSPDCSACREPLASPSQYKTAQTALPAGNLWPHLHNTKQPRLLCLQGTSGLTFTMENTSDCSACREPLASLSQYKTPTA
ncbi:hypothetical protein GWK47_017642 [Chionoecetes opilio]|uniref:Uncharacterized protein n=1 Tax=Chionoecetes opilio TaxID=41210 RepID=A0A8J4XRE3_CHIOP|nr:hypothetical protein GWK47_017642 [Chionoecetes opilio]